MTIKVTREETFSFTEQDLANALAWGKSMGYTYEADDEIGQLLLAAREKCIIMPCHPETSNVEYEEVD